MTQDNYQNSLVQSEIRKLEDKVDNLANIQSDMRDAILILTENQKKIEQVQATQEEHRSQLQAQEIRLVLVETATAKHSDKLEGVSESKFINRAIIFVAGLIATATVGLIFKVLFQWIS